MFSSFSCSCHNLPCYNSCVILDKDTKENCIYRNVVFIDKISGNVALLDISKMIGALVIDVVCVVPKKYLLKL